MLKDFYNENKFFEMEYSIPVPIQVTTVNQVNATNVICYIVDHCKSTLIQKVKILCFMMVIISLSVMK
jgi:hypothetical protein